MTYHWFYAVSSYTFRDKTFGRQAIASLARFVHKQKLGKNLLPERMTVYYIYIYITITGDPS